MTPILTGACRTSRNAIEKGQQPFMSMRVLPLRHRHCRLRVAATLLAGVLMPMAAQAIDVDVADYVPAPDGTTVGLIYYQHAERNELYTQGQPAVQDPSLVSDVGIARMVRYTKLGGLAVAPQVMLPFGRLHAGHDTSALGSTDGVGDMILALPVWPINDAATRTYLGIAPYLYLPTGSYDHNSSLNLGENRWKLDLQIGFVKGFTDKWFIDLTGDVMFFGKNNDYGAAGAALQQAALYQGQSYLRYQFTPGFNTFIGLSQTWGGNTKVNGVANDDATRQRKISLGSSYFVGPASQLLVSIGRDLKVDNGFKENARINLRLLQIF